MAKTLEFGAIWIRKGGINYDRIMISCCRFYVGVSCKIKNLGSFMSQLPLLYYPTTLYWVDDDVFFLEVVENRFKNHYAIDVAFSPQQARNFFLNYQSQIDPLLFLRSCVEHEEYDLTEHLPVDINFEAIRQLHDNSDKIKDIAVIIVDYKMPGISGIDLCRELVSIPAKKILLTGYADFQEAVHAFNEGIINCFICKDDSNIDVSLTNNINNLTREYFIERTLPLLNHIESDFKLPHSDKIFVNFFEELCKDHKVKEYYLADKNGSIIMLTTDNLIKYFIIHTDRTLDKFVELNKNIKEAAFFVRSIETRNKVPFFGIGKEAWDLEVKFWANCFYKPSILNGREKYYWTLISPYDSL